MVQSVVGKEARSGGASSVYERHRPERTLLYRLVGEHYPRLKAHLAAQDRALPGYVDREFEAYLRS